MVSTPKVRDSIAQANGLGLRAQTIRSPNGAELWFLKSSQATLGLKNRYRIVAPGRWPGLSSDAPLVCLDREHG